nr:kunitz trypsin inhibitor 2-like [Ipomoea batatas]
MKALLLILLLSLVSFFPHHEIAGASSLPSPVRDNKGEVVKVGSNYFVLPVTRGRGGGLYPANIKSNATICPLDVIQEADEVQKGIPVVLEPYNNATTVPAPWSAYQLISTSGGVEGNPGPQTLSSWFKIDKYKSVYKFVFCPTVCNYCKVICKDVGIFEQNGVRFLALTDDVPFKFEFIAESLSYENPFFTIFPFPAEWFGARFELFAAVVARLRLISRLSRVEFEWFGTQFELFAAVVARLRLVSRLSRVEFEWFGTRFELFAAVVARLRLVSLSCRVRVVRNSLECSRRRLSSRPQTRYAGLLPRVAVSRWFENSRFEVTSAPGLSHPALNWRNRASLCRSSEWFGLRVGALSRTGPVVARL